VLGDVGAFTAGLNDIRADVRELCVSCDDMGRRLDGLGSAVADLRRQTDGLMNNHNDLDRRHRDLCNSAVPLHRCWSPNGADHFYTISDAEFKSAISSGYEREGDEGFVLMSRPS
jgi:hypothetical protein